MRKPGPGRPSRGLSRIEDLEGSVEAKKRLKTVLEAAAGSLDVRTACARLGVGATRFSQLQDRALQGALHSLEGRPAGRPRKEGMSRQQERHVRRLEAALERERRRTEALRTLVEVGRAGRRAGARAPRRRRSKTRAPCARRRWRERLRSPQRLRPRREAERAARRGLLARVRVLRRAGRTWAETASDLRRPVGTLRGLLARWVRGKLPAQPRGRPPKRMTRTTRGVLTLLRHGDRDRMGVRRLHRFFPQVGRVELQRLAHRERRRGRRRLCRCLWTRAGTVWALDFTHDSHLRRGRWAILIVRDLSSGCVLWDGAHARESAKTVRWVLARLFARYGVPLVIKWDNGSPFAARRVRRAMRGPGVLLLYSPVRRPAYNGSVESTGRWIKARTHSLAQTTGSPTEWRDEHLEAARLLTNLVGSVPGGGRATPALAFARRTPIDGGERARLRACYAAFLREEWARRRGAAAVRRDRRAAAARRAAMRRALEHLGYLNVRRGPISTLVSVA